MSRMFYRMTATAERQFWDALAETQEKWGQDRAEKYRLDFLAGLQNIADNHHNFRSAYRKKLAEGTDFSIHLVEHRYVAFIAT